MTESAQNPTPDPSDPPGFDHIGVLGAGAWGTALAQTAARAGRRVTLWAFEAPVVEAINRDRLNPDYLPGLALDPAIRATADMAEILACDLVLVVCPAQFLRAVVGQASPHWPATLPAVLCAKGLERGTGALMHEVLAEVLPGRPWGVLTGPTFAAEVARGQPTAVTLAAEDPALALGMAKAVGTRSFRPYPSEDPVGSQVGGAVKNVMAIACGIVEGRGMGDNAGAALLTRGLAEIGRLAARLGGRAETVAGLSGLGDLALTASSMQSRNFSLGVALGQGQSVAEILAGRKSVAEGVQSAPAVLERAAKVGADMPITQAVADILSGSLAVDAAIEGLLSRPFRPE